MKISVIIPTYRPGAYIFECLDSLRHQTLPKNQFEVIVVLNGERNPYEEQLFDYSQKNSDVASQVFYSEEKGVSNARNLGIDQSKGQYIVFVDDDDWVSPNYLENLVAQADENCVVLSNLVAVGDDKTTPENHFISNAYVRNAGQENLTLFKTRSFFSSPVGKIIPRNVIGSNRFFSDFSLGEDSLFMFTISRRVKTIRLASADTIYYVWNRENSASRSHYSYFFRVKLAMRTTLRYITLFLKDPFNYDFPFFLSRVVATLRKLFQKTYQ